LAQAPHHESDGGAAIILAGGKSSRMGQPKALLTFGGEPLIAHLVRSLKQGFKDIVIVAAPDQQLPDLPATLVRDELPFRGPVGGLYYGLRAAREEFAFVTSCDAPFLNLSLVRFLTTQISRWDVVVPYWEDRFQPLHAVYRTNVAPLLAQQLERNELRPVTLFERVRTLKIQESEIRRFDPAGRSFINMNTPADYQAALEIWTRDKMPGDPETPSNGAAEIETEAAPGISLSRCPPVSGSVFLTVELFGAARLMAKAREIALELAQPARLFDVYGALGARCPVLVGRVVAADGRSLIPGYACNINGVDFVRDSNAQVHSGDRIFIISADAGG
jgi:molybdopterin-guanine dinucleotide biosynthesis protein A